MIERALNAGQLAALADAVPDAIIVINSARCILSFNRGAETIFGCTAAEVMEQRINLLLPSESRDDPDSLVARVAADESPMSQVSVRGLTSALRRNGLRFPADLTVTRLASQGSLIFGIVLRDVTDTIRLEQDLRNSEAHTRSMFENTLEYIGLLDTSGHVLDANNTGLRLIGVDKSAVLGKSFWDTAWWSHSPALQDRLRAAVAHVAAGGSDRFDAQHPTVAGGMVDVDFSLSPVPGSDGNVRALLAEGRDVTPQRQAMRAAQSAQLEAERALQANLRFLAVASHDLRQPLQTVIVLASILERLAKDAQVLDVVQQQQRALRSVTDLLNSLLDVTKLESGAMRPDLKRIALDAVLDPLRDEFGEIARHKTQHLQIPRCAFSVTSDPTLLREILQNLLANALRYTPRGGLISVTCQPGADDLRIEVCDSGIGIAADKLSRLFDEFYQIDASGGERSGWGLGLSIVKHAARLLGHHIDVESTPGTGTRFTITIQGQPEATPEQHAPAVATHTGAANGGRSPRILVIDDDAAVAAATALLLRVEGFRVDVAGNRADIDRLLCRDDFAPELIVADVHLQHGDTGPALAQRVCDSLQRKLPLILVSGDASATSAARASEAFEGLGVSRCLPKPMHADALLQVLRELLPAVAV